ncbi:MAG TPA: 5'-3' exonuclease H3TH domain-containing protein, partial [Pseudonocardia sp.]
MPASDRVVLAVDGNSLVHRAFHSQARTGFRLGEGRPRWAVRGLLSQLVAAVERVGPDAVVIGFDDPGASVRRERWPSYKAQRGDKLPTLVEQLTDTAEVLRELGVSVVVPPGLEADDVLASVARQAPGMGASTVVMTSDRDAFGLINEHTRVLRVINGGVEASPMLTPERLVLLLGVRPDQYSDFAALRGDPSDNLPGVRGVGPKTAARLLRALDSAEAAFADLE